MRMIGEVAELLGLETVKIFEKIITNKKVMAPFIEKDRGVTYISDEGIEQLKVLFDLVEKREDTINEESKGEEKNERHLQEEILSLKERLETKKERMSTLDGEIKRMDEMIDTYLAELSRSR